MHKMLNFFICFASYCVLSIQDEVILVDIADLLKEENDPVIHRMSEEDLRSPITTAETDPGVFNDTPGIYFLPSDKADLLRWSLGILLIGVFLLLCIV